MDRATIQRRLALAEDRVQHGIKRLERQRAIIKRLKRQGLNINPASGKLCELKASLRRRQSARNRLLAELERVLRGQLPAEDGSSVLEQSAPPQVT
jgi:hypothetical protein